MSIIKIAEVAKVSKSTVSRVLNGGKNVSPDAIAAVKAAMLELNYKGLPVRKKKPSRNLNYEKILFIAVDKPSWEFNELGYMATLPRILRGVEEAVGNCSFDLMLVDKNQVNDFEKIVNQNKPVGAIFLGDEKDCSQIVKDWMMNNPVVKLLRDPFSFKKCDMVCYNNALIGELAADYFLSNGVNNVVGLSDEPEGIFEPRLNAFESKMKENSAKVNVFKSDRFAQNNLQRLRIAEELVKLILEISPFPQGIFCSIDSLACTIHSLLIEYGKKPGEEVHIISSDNSKYYLEQMNPKPASINIGCELIGQSAVQLLSWRIKNPECKNYLSINVEPSLVLP